MKLIAAVVLALSVLPGSALAATVASPLTAPAAPAATDADAAGATRIAMRQLTLAPGAELQEHRQDGQRYIYVVSGRLKVSDLVTGDEQVVEAGKIAAERPGDWHVARALGADPVVLYLIDRTPAAGGTATAAAEGGN